MKIHQLEDKIMKVWGTADDLDVVADWISESTKEGFSVDELLNMIIGIRALHEHKSKMLFRDFEKLLASNADAIAAEYPDH
jgi:hypothetical protein|tara:strand:+ start:567 stop:809 length:243 start_codon:yes stop_codon:yes gene_type:complete